MARRRRGWGEGSVFYSRSEKAWIARVPLGTVDGRRIRKKARAGTEREARAELERLLRLYAAGGDPASMTLDSYLRSWLADHEPSVSPATAVSYRGHVERHITPLLGGILVARLQVADVRRLIAHLSAKGLSPATVGRVVTTLRIALGAAVRERAITDNAATGVRLPRVNREPVTALSQQHADRIAEAIRGDQFEALYVLLLGSGLRLGEALALDWQDVDLEGGYVRVKRGKTRASARVVPLTDRATEALREQHAKAKRVGPAEPVFLGPRTGERLAGYTVSHAFPRTLVRAGLPAMRVHDLRHGYVTLHIAAGTSMRVIADLVGHANPSMTANVYAHVVPAVQKEAVARLSARNGSQNGSHS